jgi:hypothetical protein
MPYKRIFAVSFNLAFTEFYIIRNLTFEASWDL